MALTLSIIKSPSGVSGQETQKIFSEGGGTIGRGESNDWVLSDPDRFLSSRHCSVSFEDGQFYLTDMSTNGTFMNGAAEPIGKGGKILLGDGDTVDMGDYRLQAVIQASAAALDDPFGAPIGDDFSSDNGGFGAEAEPFPNAGQLTHPNASAGDPFGGGGSDDPFGGSSHSDNPGDPFASNSFDDGADFALSPDRENADPLAALDKVGSGQVADDPFGSHDNLSGGFGGSSELDASPSGTFGDELFGSTPDVAEQMFAKHGTQGQNHDPLSQAFDMPAARNENQIPEDWDDDLLGGENEPSSDYSEPLPTKNEPPSSFQARQGGARSNLEVTGAHRSIPLTDPPKVTNSARQKPTQADLEKARLEGQAALERRRSEQEVQTQAASTASHSAQKSRDLSQSVGNALLDGMGISADGLSDQEITDIHSAIGDLMPVIINGMMQVLRARASIKNEFRMNVTTIQPVENNPLKFSADVQEAIEALFTRKSSAYMGPVQAFQEGFDGIGEHQVAIIAGIRAAFKSMMDRFNPESLERQFEKQNKGVGLPGMKKSKYWTNYAEYYNSFIDNMENTFQYLFGDEFVQAYEDQLRRLAVERKQRQKHEF